MQYPKLPPWPFIDPTNPPEGYLKVGESVDWDRSEKGKPRLWHLFAVNDYLVIGTKSWVGPIGDQPGEFAIGQYEYPIAGARWFVETVQRFFLPPDHPNAVPRGKYNVRGEVDGETLGVTRGAGFGYTGRDGTLIPGYSFDNLNRYEHSTLRPQGHRCQMFMMGDPWLFEYGLFDLFKALAERHERGEF